MFARELIHRKREGHALAPDEIAQFVREIAAGLVSDAQIAAFAMAVCLRGMDARECAALTRSMRDSGTTLDWRAEPLDGPVLDKHSTGGVGDLVSLVLAPMLAACGAYVPMVSGRGLGHTGGTLDKLEAIPGYCVQPSIDRLRRCVREVGAAIVGAGDALAPADRRIYAVRDLTDTVDSIPLITASILSKKLAAGLDALVLDVKTGNGAQTTTLSETHRLARTLVAVADAAGLTAAALVTDMNQPLAPAVGNALELRVALRYLRGPDRPARLHEVTLALGAQALVLGRLACDLHAARAMLVGVLDSGHAAERFARMVAALGGPPDLLEREAAHLATAPAVAPVRVACAGAVQAIDARALGTIVASLGGGRSGPTSTIDPRVGLDAVVPLGAFVDRDAPLAFVHAATPDAAAVAARAVAKAFRIGTQPVVDVPLIHECIGSPRLGPALQ